MSSAVEQLLEAARFIEMQELRQKRQYKVEVSGCTPPDSPVTGGNNHYTIHNVDYTNLNSTIVRTKEPFLNENTVAPPLVVISSQNHPTHSLSPRSLDASRSRSSSLSSNPIAANGVHHVLTNGEDSSQSSLNLSSASSGYVSGCSTNTSLNGNSLNVSGTQQTGSTAAQITSVHTNGNGINVPDNHIMSLSSSHPTPTTSGRRRTISSNSNGSTQRSPCILRADTREVHNKLEKNRRAHLKDCFEQLKKELPYQDEKKTSNLSILGNAFKTVQSLKLKERELEHEMERLAKDKVAQQKRILILKRELSHQIDHADSTFLLPENDGMNAGVRERFISECLSEPSVSSSGRARYSSTSSLSSATTISSPCTASIPSSTTISSTNTSPCSPKRPNSSSPTTTIPLSLISVMDSPQPLKIAQVLQQNNNTNGVSHNGNHIAINFTTSEGLSSTLLTAAANSTTSTPISLNSTQTGTLNPSLQIISTTTNSTNKLFNNVKNQKNGIRSTIIESPSINNIKDGTKLEIVQSKIDPTTEPPAKVIKLINGSIALASMVDKDSKLLSSNSLTLSQVVVPLRVNGQPSTSLATIELSNTNAQRNISNSPNGTQLHKLLVSGTTGNITSANTVLTTTATPVASELARLPGGAELNILPAGTNTTSLYRSNGKLTAIVNNGFSFKDFIGTTDSNGTNGRAVHMVTPIQSNQTSISSLTPIMVSQDQNGTNLTHIIASSQQLAGKVLTTPLSVNGQGLPIMGTQYLSTTMVKPMVVTVAGNGGGSAVQNGAITLPITSATASNSGIA